MLRFAVRRLMAVAGLLIVVSFMIFGLLQITPGSPIDALLGNRPRTTELVQSLTATYHLNDPFLVQYWHWMRDILHGNLGTSVQSDQSVTSLLAQRLPVSIELAGLALTVAVLLGVPAGFTAGVRRGGLIDRSLSSLSVVGMSAPAFAVGILFIFAFGVKLGWFPVFGVGQGFADRIAHLTLPVLTLAVSLTPLVVRQTRAAVWDVMDQDYITFARARGLSPWRIMVPYALRNSSLPIVTVTGLLAIGTMTGTVIVEQVFSIPGVGSLLVTSIQNKDIPVAQGVALVIALVVLTINLVVDMLVLALDPRTRNPRGV
ncbi:ABC transporter permease [Jatrophihabitans sp. DSM 45814]